MQDITRDEKVICLGSHGVSSIADINLINSLSIKKQIIEQARQWSIYFCRFFPISYSNEIQILGISHSGIRLIKQNRRILEVFEIISFDMIQRISLIENNSTIDLYLTKKKITIHSNRVEIVFLDLFLLIIFGDLQMKKIQEMIDKYLKEFHILTPSTCDLLKSSSQISLMSCSQTSRELEIPTLKSSGYSMMEFAVQNFKIPNRRSKKSWKTLGVKLNFFIN